MRPNMTNVAFQMCTLRPAPVNCACVGLRLSEHNVLAVV